MPAHCGYLAERVIVAPMVVNDLPGYESPIDGRWIEGRRARHEDLKRNHCRPWETGEREYQERVRQNHNTDFDASVDADIERQVSLMPARKRELLEQEVRAGATAQVVRNTV